MLLNLHHDVYQSDGNSNELTKVADGHEDNYLHNYQLTIDRIPREIRKPIRFAKADLIYYDLATSVDPNFNEPDTYKEAMTSKDSNKWIRVMDDSNKLCSNWKLHLQIHSSPVHFYDSRRRGKFISKP